MTVKITVNKKRLSTPVRQNQPIVCTLAVDVDENERGDVYQILSVPPSQITFEHKGIQFIRDPPKRGTYTLTFLALSGCSEVGEHTLEIQKCSNSGGLPQLVDRFTLQVTDTTPRRKSVRKRSAPSPDITEETVDVPATSSPGAATITRTRETRVPAGSQARIIHTVHIHVPEAPPPVQAELKIPAGYKLVPIRPIATIVREDTPATVPDPAQRDPTPVVQPVVQEQPTPPRVEPTPVQTPAEVLPVVAPIEPILAPSIPRPSWDSGLTWAGPLMALMGLIICIGLFFLFMPMKSGRILQDRFEAKILSDLISRE